MKKLYFLLFVILISKIYSQTVNIPDANFKAKLLESNATNYIARDLSGNFTKIDQNNDGEIQVSEAENISALSINNRNIDFVFYFFVQRETYEIKEIYSLVGISSFKNLKIIDCAFAKITSIDFKDLDHITQIYCDHNQITEFTNFQYIKSPFVLDCSFNKLTSLDLRNSSLINIQGVPEVLFKFDNNNLQYLNLQNNKKNAWYCLCSPIDGACPFPGNMQWNTCTYIPKISENPLLTEVFVNCGEKEKFQVFGNSSIVFTENCEVAATNEIDFKAHFKIFPNPARDYINVETRENIDEVTILDFSGKLISKHQNNFNKIPVSSLTKGNYVLKIKSNQRVVAYKFIKD